MIARDIADTIIRLAAGFPIIALTGPRQSGKTTLARALFNDRPYVSLEDPDSRLFALSDPRGFLARFPDGAVIDEAQRAPEIFSYLQSHVDADRRMGLYVLTGSHQFGLRAGITQSLAGRVGTVSLLPFSHRELRAAGRAPELLTGALYTGGYPPLYDRPIAPHDWHSRYIATYLERDLHQLINVKDLATFQTFLKMCAARTGQIVNLSGLATDCGVTHATIREWLSVLEASYVVFRLHPHHRNFSKRLIKSPKLYFYDSGLAAHLLGVENAGALATHAMRGPLFENWIVAELVKERFNRGMPLNLYFWRDRSGLEVDVIAEHGDRLQPIEIKSGATITDEFFRGLARWCAVSQLCAEARPILYYGGDEDQDRTHARIRSWRSVGEPNR